MAAARAGLAGLAAMSLCLSALPRVPAFALILVLLPFTAWRLRRALAVAPVALRIADDGGWVVLLESQRRPVLLRACRVQVRGALATVRARGPRGERLAWTWWPDTLDAAGLRKLRLASGGRGAQTAAALATMPG
jgi:hypothetical protein